MVTQSSTGASSATPWASLPTTIEHGARKSASVYRCPWCDDVPNERTIDVHVRRLRAKLGGYDDIVRTVRGAGYRFDRHADVSIRYASTPSPDFF